MHLQHTKKQATSDPTFSASSKILDIRLPGRFHINNLCIKECNISKVGCHHSVEEDRPASLQALPKDRDTPDSPTRHSLRALHTVIRTDRPVGGVGREDESHLPSLREENLLMPASVIQRSSYSNYLRIITDHFILLQLNLTFKKLMTPRKEKIVFYGTRPERSSREKVLL